MSNYRHFRDLEGKGIDLVELLGGDRSMLSDDFSTVINTIQGVGDELYSDLLYLLSYHRFREAEAKHIWRGILKHKRRLEQTLGRDPGVRVAALDYLTNLRGMMTRPRIVDREDFEQLVGFVHIDELTGLYNRRHLKRIFQREIRRARRYSKALTVMLIDVDNFKSVNDTYGHAAGDEVLIALGKLLTEVCRETDTIGRYGGDEILVLLPEARKSDAYSLAERIRRAARDSEIEVDGDDTTRLRFSVSIGLATYPDDSQDASELLQLSDEALYNSKRRGRDVVSLYRPGDDEDSESAPLREVR